VRDQVIVDMRLVRGELTVEIGRQQEPYAATRRGLRVSGAADLLHRGDVLLSSGDPAGARAAYLDVLQTAPGHPDLLLELAEIDLAEGSRAESCLSFLEELDKSPIQPLSRESTVRRHLTWSRALVASGRQDAARESLAAAQSLEVDGIMAALFACDLSESVKGDARRSELLDEAVARAPLLPRARRMHFDFSLSRGDQSAAARDAEQLEAACTSAEERALVCISLAEAYMEAGYPDQTERWLRRGLRFRPDDARLQLRLAWGLAQTKQPLRAAELLTAALHTLGAQREGLTALEHVPTSALEELSTLQGQAHFQLAELLVEVNDDLPSALAHLSSVPSRSALAAKARVLESELFHRMGRLSERDRVLGRLLEAVELGWIPAQDVREQKERLLNLLSLEPESATTRSLHRVLAEPV
jgi:tetratricopeptide (TPR) repeat protein